VIEEEIAFNIEIKDNGEDMIFKQQKAHSALSVQHQSLSKKAIKNCIAMWRNYTYYQVFQKWKLETRHHQIVKEKLSTSVFLRL